MAEEFISCPTCRLPAEVIAPLPYGTDRRSLCPRGHENTLVPAVYAYLKELADNADKAAERSA